MTANFANSPTTGDTSTQSGKKFIYDGSAWQQLGVVGNVINVQFLTSSSGTITPSPGAVAWLVRMRGGGGGGGGAANSSAGQIDQGGGGGEGAYVEAILTASQFGSGLAYVVGAGGTGATAGNNTGTAGSDTTIATTLLVAKGGSGGGGAAANNASSAGAGGLASTSTGTTKLPGLNGTPGTGGSSAAYYFPGGNGGGNGAGLSVFDGAGAAATANTGAGGAGGTSYNASGAKAGGNGGSGWIEVIEYGNASTNPAYVPAGLIWGLTLSNSAGDATNDIDIAAGRAADSGNGDIMILTSSITKQLDAAWAVGTNAGGLDTGAIANTTYHVWLIKRPDTGVVDVLYSTSATSPTMPANYTLKRRIGSIVRTGAAIKGFVQDGDLFMWKDTVADISATNPGTSAVTRTLTLPVGIRVLAKLAVVIFSGTAHVPLQAYISDLSVTDATASSVQNTTVYHYDSAATAGGGGQADVMTNTSAQVRSRIDSSDGSGALYMNTQGWIDTRGRLA